MQIETSLNGSSSSSTSQSPLKSTQPQQNSPVQDTQQNNISKSITNNEKQHNGIPNDNVQYLHKQVYFWKKCYDDCQKDIIKLQEIIHQQKLMRDEKENNDSTKTVPRSKQSNGFVNEENKKRKRKEDIFDRLNDVPTYEEINRIRIESIKNQVRYETLKSVLLKENNNLDVVPALCKVIKELNASVNSLRNSLVNDSSLKEELANAKKKIITLESQNLKYKSRIEELEKSLKEVLVHVLENEQSCENANSNKIDNKKKQAIEECMKDLDGMVDVINETNAPFSGQDSS